MTGSWVVEVVWLIVAVRVVGSRLGMLLSLVSGFELHFVAIGSLFLSSGLIHSFLLGSLESVLLL